MKKAIAILLILVIGMVGVFADVDTATDTLKLYTKIEPRYGLVISDSAATGDSTLDLLTSFEDLTPIEKVGFMTTENDSFESDSLYVNYMTNQNILATVTTTMLPLSSGTLTTKIGYKVTVDGVTDPYVVANNSSGVLVKFIEESTTTEGMRVATKKFSILLDEGDWNLANAANEYFTTWTVELATN